MFERFTGDARSVVVHAQDFARVFRHPYIGTEHLLLAFFRIEDSIPTQVLKGLGLKEESLKEACKRLLKDIAPNDQTTHIPFTPRAKKVLELALREALALGDNYIAPEHIMIGLMRECGNGPGETVAGKMLMEAGTYPGAIQDKVFQGIIVDRRKSKQEGSLFEWFEEFIGELVVSPEEKEKLQNIAVFMRDIESAWVVLGKQLGKLMAAPPKQMVVQAVGKG